MPKQDKKGASNVITQNFTVSIDRNDDEAAFTIQQVQNAIQKGIKDAHNVVVFEITLGGGPDPIPLP